MKFPGPVMRALVLKHATGAARFLVCNLWGCTADRPEHENFHHFIHHCFYFKPIVHCDVVISPIIWTCQKQNNNIMLIC